MASISSFTRVAIQADLVYDDQRHTYVIPLKYSLKYSRYMPQVQRLPPGERWGPVRGARPRSSRSLLPAATWLDDCSRLSQRSAAALRWHGSPSRSGTAQGIVLFHADDHQTLK